MVDMARRRRNQQPKVAPMSRNIVILAAAGLAAVVGGTFAATFWTGGDPRFADCATGQVAGGAIGGPFTLTDETGATVTDADLLTRPALIYFGFTFCPSICPTDAQRNAFAVELLDEQGIEVTPIFITIDPARDTPDVLAAFTDAFHPRMIGLTGTEDQIDAAKAAWRVIGEREVGGDDEFYQMRHTTFTYLTLPGYGFVEFFPSETTPEEMADAVQCFVTQA
jgi:protein SCO1